MNYIYSAITFASHAITELCSLADILRKDVNANQAQINIVLTTLGPVVKYVTPIIEQEFPQYRATLEWVEEQYAAYLANKS